MIKDCAWVPQHRRTRLLLPNTSKPIARFSVSGFALYPLSILIGVHNDAGLAPQPRGRPHHAPVNSSIPRMFGYCSSSIPRMFQILLRLGLSVAFEDHIHDGRAVFAMIGLALSLRAVRPTGSSPRTRLARSSGRKRKIGAGDASHDATDRAAQAEFEANWRRWRNLPKIVAR
jgi:hypothetical protein